MHLFYTHEQYLLHYSYYTSYLYFQVTCNICTLNGVVEHEISLVPEKTKTASLNPTFQSKILPVQQAKSMCFLTCFAEKSFITSKLRQNFNMIPMIRCKRAKQVTIIFLQNRNIWSSFTHCFVYNLQPVTTNHRITAQLYECIPASS